MASDPRGDLFWLAFRYVAGEMDADESAAFEDRLAHDQTARESVADAVALTEAVTRAASTTTDRRPLRRSFGRKRLAAVLAMAAAVAIVSLVGYLSTKPRESTPAVPTHLGPEESVALAWSGLHQPDEGAAVAHVELMAWLDDPIAPGEPSAAPLDFTDADEESLSPWLLEAASLRAGTAPGGSGTLEN